MFDHIFKRSVNSPETPPALCDDATTEQSIRDKERVLQQARSLSGEESDAVEFILQCPIADARLIAAEAVHSKAMLERVLAAVRNTDRRVSKLMQIRLDALTLDQRSEHQAQQCVDRALQLIDEPVLLANHVVDLDHAWQAIATPSDAIRAAYGNARAVLRERLEAQALLQRAVIGNLARLRELSSHARSMSLMEVLASFEQIEQDMAQHLAGREAQALPKNLLADFSEQHRQFTSSLEELKAFHQDVAARQALLQEWEEASLASRLTAESLKRTWQQLPALPDETVTATLQLRFDALLQRLAVVVDTQRPTAAKPRATLDVVKTLESLEKALQEGATRAAVDFDKLLHTEELRGVRLSAAQAGHLARMRSELSHLQGWAKWGGNISREELLKAAEGLPAQALPAAELAKKVGGLRDRWKSLDTQSGAAGKDIWGRFDAACTLAYAPAAAHFKKLSDERRANLLKAEALIVEVRQFTAVAQSAEGDASTVDWKALASFCSHAAQRWQRLGGIDRKEKKRLDEEFGRVLKLLEAPLAAQRQADAAQRENLITQALALNATDRGALDAIRGLQDRWQQMAKVAPLERKVEQALWKKFRAACDALFAKRKDAAAGADAERKRHLAEKEELCAKLESSLAEPVPAIAKLLRETKDAWNRIGQVPRAAEKQIEARLQAAVNALQQLLDAAKRTAADAERNALLNKVRLCQRIEQALGGTSELAAPSTLEQWQALPALSNEYERPLRARFDMALKALDAGDEKYRALLEKNRGVLLQQILRVEIVAGVESPAELSRERLKMQVEVLQSALKNGPMTNKQGPLLELCTLPALADQATMARMEHLIGKLNRAN